MEDLLKTIAGQVGLIKWLLVSVTGMCAVMSLCLVVVLLRVLRAGRPAPAAPQPKKSFSDIANDMLAKNKLDELIVYANTQIKEDPNHFQAHYCLALALYRKNQFKEALAAFEKSKQVNPQAAHDYVDPYIERIKQQAGPAKPPPKKKR